MQSRNSGNQNRIILIGCVLLLLVTGVLYFVKRMEANKLHSELGITKVEMREREDDLNLKLTDYLLKMEEMTRQLGDLQSKHISCEDAKKKIGGDTLTAKNAVEECHKQQAQNIVKQGDLEDELADLKNECEGAHEQVKSHLATMSQLQQTAKESEIELTSCQAQATQCQTSLTGMQGELVQLRARCNQQQQVQQQPQMVQQPAQQLGQQMFPNNPGAIYKPKASVPNQAAQFQNQARFPNRQQQSAAQEQVEKEPPSEEEGGEEEEVGDTLLGSKEEEGGDGGGNDDQGPVGDEPENKDLFDDAGKE